MSRTQYYTDGGCLRNGSECPEMRAVVVDGTGSVVYDRSCERPGGSSNIAELWAIVMAAKHAYEAGHRMVLIRLDSQIAASWATKGAKSAEVRQRPIYARLMHLLGTFKLAGLSVRFQWVPRGENLAGLHIEGKWS